ncbi:HBR035Wp [Eremothecium sinecaudum]|uniref:non-specific serine/threonine protein kinase n=1 Tax=Eremothecium sinecaudum TaxID=45286 RepID=A0A125RDY7_9SACH|nr:HBR035Wp [Eremothecium sinecaudum]AMD18936.1 HBR035Wp [Eremothecium sinecaudum]
MPTTAQDYHVNNQFQMGSNASGLSGISNQAVVAPATPRMMGKGSISGSGGAPRGGQVPDAQHLMPAAEMSDSQSGSNGKPVSAPRPSQKPFHRKSLGDWDFMETVGAGSMGKVKLAKHRVTNELCAIKIVNRATKSFVQKQQQQQKLLSPATEEEVAERRKKLEKEVSRDKRTVREASLGQILYHPHICRLFEMCTMSNHYYMLFEYVSGGQLLDYIIQHGSLRERHARRFARGIASALQYLHLNNIVHRDLKIENIMISSSGEIKIIDFGLSNLYDSRKQLHTFCGSLYFAAPELLKANPYTGPEVDIWSFGVVLYVLVCGKVPFDDENANVLHEKIKKGKVEYPQHLSIDVISLLSKMLVVEPSKRATLSQVVNHQWMLKGYDFPAPSYLPPCVPLKVEQINLEVIKEMHKLELVQDIQETKQWLEKLVMSDEYEALAASYWEKSNSATLKENPMRAFNPLLSIYNLVDEMLKRKRSKLKKAGEASNSSASFAAGALPVTSSAALSAGSCTSSITGKMQTGTAPSTAAERKPQQQLSPKSPQQLHSTSNSGATPSPSANGVAVSKNQSVNYVSPTIPSKHVQTTMIQPQLTIPKQAHTVDSRKTTLIADAEPEDTVLSPAPQSHDFEVTNSKFAANTASSHHSTSTSTSSTEKHHIGSIFRRLSQRHHHTASQGASQQNYTHDVNTAHQPSQIQPPIIQPMLSIRTAEAHSRAVSEFGPSLKYVSGITALPNDNPRGGNSEAHSQLPALPYNAASLVKQQQILQHNMQELGLSGSNTASPTSGQGRESVDEDKPLKQLSVQKGRRLHPSARAKSVGHARRESLKFMRPAVATQVSPQDINDEGFLENSGEARSEFVGSNGLESVDEELSDKQILDLAAKAPAGSMPSIDFPRSLFLKGFFSVQTTSSKPLPIVRYKIISTLKKLNIEFNEVKGGFTCVHRQSYVTNKVPPNLQTNTFVADTSPTNSSNNNSYVTAHRRQLSIPSRHGSIRRQHNAQPNIPNTPQAAAIHERSLSITSQSFGGSSIAEELSTASLESLHQDDILTTSKAQDMNNKNLEMQQEKERPPLRFEIHIVKVRIVGLAGVHFKKVSGNTWMYKELASHILKELNL